MKKIRHTQGLCLPSHVKPSPVKGELHAQVKPFCMSLQVASMLQLCVPSEHSSTSVSSEAKAQDMNLDAHSQQPSLGRILVNTKRGFVGPPGSSFKLTSLSLRTIITFQYKLHKVPLPTILVVPVALASTPLP